MSTLIQFSTKELKKLASNKNSCVKEKAISQNVALQPWCLGNIEQSVKDIFDYKIGKFDKKFNGILLGYRNLCKLQNVGAMKNDSAEIYFQIKADFFIFRPTVGAVLKGVVNKKSDTHLGILLHRVFNVVIPRPTEEPGSEWIGTRVQEGQKVKFRVAFLDLYGALPYIRGELDERWLKEDMVDDCIVHKSVDVPYIDFDKTKPSHKRANSECSNQEPSNLLDSSTQKVSNNKHRKENGDYGSPAKKSNIF